MQYLIVKLFNLVVDLIVGSHITVNWWLFFHERTVN